ncbi:SDR family NAD(P)-dependent oxidoreductase [Streptomyces sp. NPDC091292]|uniref:SDR family NAD(P)-dependent oxidoreductase n=1 Tax=Streptomyces sp. NPDC091292 TaxID=3365991 RepID=UPI00381566BA
MGVLDQKTAIVTGSGGGIGRGIARALAKEGAAVAVIDVDAEAAERTAEEIREFGADALALPCDIRDRNAVDAAVNATVRRFDTVDILVNNAMAARTGVPIEHISDDDLELAFRTGPMATVYFMRACHPHLKDGGRVINLRSGSEIQGLPGYGSYISAKAAVGGITRAAAREWGQQGITVNAICPFALSEAAQAHFEARPYDLTAALSSLSIKRTGDTESDIGRAAVYLAGPDASFVTGCTIMIDGGGSFLG